MSESATDWTAYFSTATAKDIAYIRDSWLASYYRSPWAGAVPNNAYRDVYTLAIDQLLARGAKLLVIRNAANKDMLVAWVCFELTGRQEAIIHFAYTKPAYRRSGAAKALIDAVLHASKQDKFFFTFRTSSSRFFRNGTFRPEIARRRDSKGRLDA